MKGVSGLEDLASVSDVIVKVKRNNPDDIHNNNNNNNNNNIANLHTNKSSYFYNNNKDNNNDDVIAMMRVVVRVTEVHNGRKQFFKSVHKVSAKQLESFGGSFSPELFEEKEAEKEEAEIAQEGAENKESKYQSKEQRTKNIAAISCDQPGSHVTRAIIAFDQVYGSLGGKERVGVVEGVAELLGLRVEGVALKPLSNLQSLSAVSLVAGLEGVEEGRVEGKKIGEGRVEEKRVGKKRVEEEKVGERKVERGRVEEGKGEGGRGEKGEYVSVQWNVGCGSVEEEHLKVLTRLEKMGKAETMGGLGGVEMVVGGGGERGGGERGGGEKGGGEMGGGKMAGGERAGGEMGGGERGGCRRDGGEMGGGERGGCRRGGGEMGGGERGGCRRDGGEMGGGERGGCRRGGGEMGGGEKGGGARRGTKLKMKNWFVINHKPSSRRIKRSLKRHRKQKLRLPAMQEGAPFERRGHRGEETFNPVFMEDFETSGGGEDSSHNISLPPLPSNQVSVLLLQDFFPYPYSSLALQPHVGEMGREDGGIWVIMKPKKLIAFPLSSHVGRKQIELVGEKEGGGVDTATLHVTIQPPPPPPSHHFQATLDADANAFVNDVKARYDIVNRISSAFGDPDPTRVTLTKVEKGSLELGWSNNSLVGCEGEEVERLMDVVLNREGVVSEAFRRAMQPLVVVSAEATSACSASRPLPPPVEKHPAGPVAVPRPRYNPQTLFFLVIGLIIAAAVVLLLLCCCCLYCWQLRKRRRSEKKHMYVTTTDHPLPPFSSPPSTTSTKGVPVILASEMKVVEREEEDRKSLKGMDSVTIGRSSLRSCGRGGGGGMNGGMNGGGMNGGMNGGGDMGGLNGGGGMGGLNGGGGMGGGGWEGITTAPPDYHPPRAGSREATLRDPHTIIGGEGGLLLDQELQNPFTDGIQFPLDPSRHNFPFEGTYSTKPHGQLVISEIE